jgi:hypothetical protein
VCRWSEMGDGKFTSDEDREQRIGNTNISRINALAVIFNIDLAPALIELLESRCIDLILRLALKRLCYAKSNSPLDTTS